MNEAKTTGPADRTPVPAVNVWVAVRYFAQSADLQRRLLAGTRLRPEKSPNADVRLADLIGVQKNLTDVIGEDWPLRLAPVIDSRMLGALEVAFRSARTFGDSLAVTAKYANVRAPQFRYGLKRTRTTTRLVFSKNASLAESAWRAACLSVTVAASALSKAVLGPRARMVEFQFPWREPSYASLARAAFPGTVKFAAKECALVAPSALCDIVSPFADAALFAGAVAELKRAAHPPQELDLLLMNVMQFFDGYGEGRPNELELTRALGVSRRTLARRLHESGTTFRALLDEHLKHRAEELRRDRRYSQGEIAHMLGFEDPSSFSRACRRWFSD
jgi:AraC-like DNA-binding protein